MKNLNTILIPILFLALAFSCSEDESPKRNSTVLTGRWNGYEMGSQAEGFVPGAPGLIASRYAHGLTFFENGTFAYRSNFDFNKGWEESPTAGTYIVHDSIIELTHDPGTPDERVYLLEIIKLDADHLWIHDKAWSSHASGDEEPEQHLKRVD